TAASPLPNAHTRTASPDASSSDSRYALSRGSSSTMATTATLDSSDGVQRPPDDRAADPGRGDGGRGVSMGNAVIMARAAAAVQGVVPPGERQSHPLPSVSAYPAPSR